MFILMRPGGGRVVLKRKKKAKRVRRSRGKR